MRAESPGGVTTLQNFQWETFTVKGCWTKVRLSAFTCALAAGLAGWPARAAEERDPVALSRSAAKAFIAQVAPAERDARFEESDRTDLVS